MKKIIISIMVFWSLVLPCQAESLKSAGFSGKLLGATIDGEADLQIISISPNDFGLLPGELIRVNFYPSEAHLELKPESLLSGSLFYAQAEINQEPVDWYMVKDYQISPPPLLNERVRKLLIMTLGLVAVGSALAAEKIRQKQKKLL